MPNVLPLERILANRTWLRREQPFAHVIARDVFRAEFYSALAAEMQGRLADGLCETPSPYRFSRSLPGYDWYGIGFDPSFDGPSTVFLSPAWRDLLSGLFSVGPTPYMFAGSHYHAVGSTSGFIHNDFNPVWFPRAVDGEIQVPNNTLCSYTRGDGSLASHEKIQVVRGAVALFFLLNDDWRLGDGGTLGLFTSPASRISEPAVTCPPLNNSLVAFECTPRSFHAFLTNRRLPRTSIIVWVHRTTDEALGRFGADQLEQWLR